MKIFKLSQNVNNDYDTYDSMIVIAENEEQAKRMHPSFDDIFYDEDKKKFWNYNIVGEKYLFENEYGSWTNDLSKIEVEYIGEAKEGEKKRLVLASFNAG